MTDVVDPRSTSSTNYGWPIPTVGGDVDAWGGELNTMIAGVDSTVYAKPNVTIGTSPPANPNVGDFYYDSNECQLYLYYNDGTSSQWVVGINALGAYLALSGGSMTGPLILSGDPTQPLGAVTKQYSDLKLPLVGGTLTGALTVAPASGAPVIAINKAASGVGNQVQGQTAGVLRWSLTLGDNTTETGSGNAGSAFSLYAYSDAGALLGNWLSIIRATGNATFAGPSLALAPSAANQPASFTMTANGAAGASIYLNRAAAQAAGVWGRTGASTRWFMAMADASAESGSNAGSNFALYNYTDAGAGITTPMWISRASSVTTFSNPIVNGSDLRLKDDIRPIADALAIVKRLAAKTYVRKLRPDKREVGLIAQDVLAVLPEAVEETPQPEIEGVTHEFEGPVLGIAYSQITALLAEAVKQLAARVEALEAR